jgi:sugar lactone lactonase YvrE
MALPHCTIGAFVTHAFFTAAGAWPLQRWVAVASIALLVACGGGNSDPIASRDAAARRSAIVAAPPPPPPQSNFPLDLLAGEADAIGNLDGPALAARFNNPGGAVSDADGNLYVTDTNNQTIRKITAAGVVSTIAGRSSPFGSHADGPGDSARFAWPKGIARDRRGNLYVADTGSRTIRRLKPDGSGGWVVDTIAGKAFEAGAVDGAAADARFRSPWALALDTLGNVYVADAGNHAVRRIQRDTGMVETYAGLLGVSGDAPAAPGVPRLATRFASPRGIAIDSHGNLFVADYVNRVVQMISVQTQTAITLVRSSDEFGEADGEGYPGAGTARLSIPTGLAVDRSDRVLVTSLESTIRAITVGPSVTLVTTVAGNRYEWGDADGPLASALFSSPEALHVTPAGDIVVMELQQATLRKISSGPNPSVTTFAGARVRAGGADGVGAAARFSVPGGLALSSSTELLVTDVASIRAVDGGGRVRTVAGDGYSGFQDGAAATARFFSPKGVAISPDGAVYVADVGNCAVRRIANSQVSTFAGKPGECQVVDGPPSVARFNWPWHIAAEGNGGLLVADLAGNVLRRVHADGSVRTIAGAAGQCGATDGDALTVGRLCAPNHVAIAPDGAFYVADTVGVRRIAQEPDGRLQITTVFRATMAANGYRVLSIAVDQQGVLHVGLSDHTIRRVAADGELTLLAGKPHSQSFVPGSLPGVLSEPQGMVVQPDGTLLFSTGRGIGIARPGTYLPCTPSTC